MRAKSRYSLQRTMIIYFLLIGFASLLVGMEFLGDFQSGTLKKELWQNISKPENAKLDPEVIFAPIDRLRSKAILMVGIVMFVMLIVLTMFIKNITEPLQHMIKLSQKISGGDLNHTIRVHASNELADLGNVINDLASNLQEIILLSRRTCENGQAFVAQALQHLDGGTGQQQDDEQMRRAIEALGEELSMLNEVIAYFSFYTLEKKGNA